jgi:NitT/TauT family transport system substrate-binding protein
MPHLSLTRRTLLKASLAVPLICRAGLARAATTDLKFSLAAPFDGSNAAFFLADLNGWYRDANLNCQFDTSGGSGEAVSRVGSGVYDVGVGDINVMTEFNARNPDAAIRDVYMLYYRSPLCVGTLTKSGMTKPADLAGRKVGAAAPDGAYRLFSAYTKAIGLDPSTIQWDMVGLQLREAVLARGDVDAILGFDSTMFFGLQKAGIKPDDIRFFYYADAGLDLYGNGIMASKKLRTENPDALKRFVAVTARAWQAAIADPDAAIAALQKHSSLINVALETAKLNWLIKNQLVTTESKADGLGGVREERLAKAIATLSTTYGFATAPKPEDVYDPSFLPSADLRKLPA